MQLYIWRKRTPIALYLADHTWITSYDLRINNYNDINQVITAQENYWYCIGDFHINGDLLGQINCASHYPTCLVIPNDAINGAGSIIRYGIDGVCHQVSNQVLYRSKKSFNNLQIYKARGYKYSSLFFGTYGLNKDVWNKNKINCLGYSSSRTTKSLLTIRANKFARNHIINQNIIQNLESQRLNLLNSLESEGTAIKGLMESTNQRVEKMNLLINEYAINASNLIDKDLYEYIFGVEPGVRIDLIDAEQFKFIN